MAGDYTSWHVGMKVVCCKQAIRPSGFCRDETLPEMGCVYTIRSLQAEGDDVYCRLVEIVNPVLPYENLTVECDFHCEGFRPVQTRKTDISVFEKLLRPIDAKLKETV